MADTATNLRMVLNISAPSVADTSVVMPEILAIQGHSRQRKTKGFEERRSGKFPKRASSLGFSDTEMV
jgi:hypothetical protein